MGNTILDKEFKYYLANQNELVKKYDGRHLVIIGESVVADYESFEQALFTSQEQYEIGTFLIQKCSEGNKDYTATLNLYLLQNTGSTICNNTGFFKLSNAVSIILITPVSVVVIARPDLFNII